MPKFSKTQRLLNSNQFQAIRGTRLTVSTPQLLILAQKNPLHHARLGLTVSKRNVRPAVERNRLKRIARESFRHYAAQLPALDIVFMPRVGADKLTNREIRQCVDELWGQLIKRSHSFA